MNKDNETETEVALDQRLPTLINVNKDNETETETARRASNSRTKPQRTQDGQHASSLSLSSSFFCLNKGSLTDSYGLMPSIRKENTIFDKRSRMA